MSGTTANNLEFLSKFLFEKTLIRVWFEFHVINDQKVFHHVKPSFRENHMVTGLAGRRCEASLWSSCCYLNSAMKDYYITGILQTFEKFGLIFTAASMTDSMEIMKQVVLNHVCRYKTVNETVMAMNRIK